MTTVMGGDEPEPLACHRERVVVEPMQPDDRERLAEMLRRCSPASLYHRFHGFSDGSAYLQRQLRTEPDIVRLAWSGPACVGFGVLAENGDRPWNLGLLVEDRWQLHGVGTRLLLALSGEARRRRMTAIEADILREDAFTLGLLRRVGAIRTETDRETVTVQVSLATAGAW